ncbi:MAG: tail fiber domain-containing protein [Burkholderiales bacterium]
MRKVLLLTVVAIFASVTQPARAQFCPGVSPWVFDDVLASDPFCGYITWMAQNGISLGCQVIDANHRLYCPSGTVTRAAMAAFMNRLGNVRVEVVGTGPGLTGGPITGIGTINLATTQLLPTTACANGQIARWNGSAWACSTDANSGGTVTSVGSGTGLTGGPITSSGTLSIAAGYQLPQGCTNGQIPKSNGAGGWTCAADASSGGTVTSVAAGAGLTGGTITTAGTLAVDTSVIQSRVTGTCPAGSSIRVIAANGTVTCQADNTGPANAFVLYGNAFGQTASVGTVDNWPLELIANNRRALRITPNSVSPNVVGGHSDNGVSAGVRGAFIGGGGVAAGGIDPVFGNGAPNVATAVYGTIGGGFGNVTGAADVDVTRGAFATVGGGRGNAAKGESSTIAGGEANTALGPWSTIGGGSHNQASSESSTVGGGSYNTASGLESTVFGGIYNTASGDGSMILGGNYSTASGDKSMILGGNYNTASGPWSLAAGSNAHADTEGCFLFANWGTEGSGSCLGVPYVARFQLSHGLSVDYGFRRPDGGGTRWVYIGDALGNNNTITTSTTAVLTDYGVWANASDRALKEGFHPIDPREVLEGVIALPVTRWRYRTEPEQVSHIGPTAQDFKAAFGLGMGDKTIGTVDSEGVALAAIQGLNAKLESASGRLETAIAERDATIAEQAREIADLKAAYATEIAELKRAIDVLLARTSPEGRVASR